MIINQGIKHN